MKRGIIFLVIVCCIGACANESIDSSELRRSAEPMHQSMKKLSDVIVHDIFSPPQASRIYAYPSIAAYEIIIQDTTGYQSLAGQLNGLEPVPQASPDEEHFLPLASIHAFLTVGKALIFSEQMIEEFEEEIYGEYKKLLPSKVFDQSMAYGAEVSRHILAWADKDNYKETRTFPKYSVKASQEASRWQPTPPDYMDGIEPHWREIRPFVLDSAQQFTPPPPTEFSLDPSSQFYQETMEVYEALQAQDKEERVAIDKFWDCNPYVSHHTGHVMYATKKITPGGHWIGITQIAGKKAQADIVQAMEAYTLTSIALADAFISCWDEKYRSNLIRPETVINQHIDENWRPTLQTPPFPEYTSGHSVISRAAAVALSSIFGHEFSFEDTTENEFGLPTRNFDSFFEASEEAALSRLYGGIHYRPAIEVGVQQGQKVGEFVISQVKMKNQLSSK